MCFRYSFFYLCVWKKWVQIAINENYTIVYKTKTEQLLDGFSGIITVNKGEYLLVVNNSKTGFEITKSYC